MASPFAPAQVDFSMLANLPNIYAQGEEIGRQRQLRNAFSDGLPMKDGVPDWDMITAEITKYDPLAGAKIAADRAGAEAMAGYRMQSLIPPDLRVYGGSLPGGGPNVTPTDTTIGSGTAPGGPYASSPSSAPPAKLDPYVRSTAEIKADEARAAKAPEEAQKARGRKQLSDNLLGLGQSYVKLKESGAYIDPSRSWGENFEAWARTSGAGQYLGGMVGSETQAIVDRINTMRPALISAIRQSTGMSAKAMDSNTELQFYLQQATDPNISIAANFAAIDALDKAYGLGGALDQILPPELVQSIRSGSPSIAQPPAAPTPGQDLPRDRFGAPQPAPEHVNALKSALAQHPPEDHEEIMAEWERQFPQYGAGAAYHFLGIEGR
jgi:hypothetical protein